MILDPCVGSGIFVEKLLESGIARKQIFAYDINSDFKDEIEKLGIDFKVQDTLLTIFPDSYNEFDFIVGSVPRSKNWLISCFLHSFAMAS